MLQSDSARDALCGTETPKPFACKVFVYEGVAKPSITNMMGVKLRQESSLIQARRTKLPSAFT